MFNKKSTNIFGNNHGTIISAVLIMSLMIVSTVPFIPEAEAHNPICKLLPTKTYYTPVIYIEEPRANRPSAGGVSLGANVSPGDSLAYVFLYKIEGAGCKNALDITKIWASDGLFTGGSERTGEDYIKSTKYKHYNSTWVTTHERNQGDRETDSMYYYSFDGETDGLSNQYETFPDDEKLGASEDLLSVDYLTDTSLGFNKGGGGIPASGASYNDHTLSYYKNIFRGYENDYKTKHGYIDIHPGYYRDNWKMCDDKQSCAGNGGGSVTVRIKYDKLVAHTCPGPPPYHCHIQKTIYKTRTLATGIEVTEPIINVDMKVILINDHDGYLYNNMDGSFYSGDYFAVKTNVDMKYAERKHIRLDAAHLYDSDTLDPVFEKECWNVGGCTAIFEPDSVPYANLWGPKGSEFFMYSKTILIDKPLEWDLEFGESIHVYKLLKTCETCVEVSRIESLRTSVAAYNINRGPTTLDDVGASVSSCDDIELYDDRKINGDPGYRYCKIIISDSTRYNQVLPTYDTTPIIKDDRLVAGVGPPSGGEYLDLDRVPYEPVWTWKPFIIYDDDGEFAIDNRLGVAIHYHGSNGVDHHEKYPLTYYQNKHKSLLTPLSSLFYPNITENAGDRPTDITNPTIPVEDAHFNGLNPHGVYRYLTEDCRKNYYNITARCDDGDTYISTGISGNYLIASIISGGHDEVDKFANYKVSEKARTDTNNLQPVATLIVFEDRRSKLNGITHYPSGVDINNNPVFKFIEPANITDASGNLLIKYNNDTNSKHYGTMYEDVLVQFKHRIPPVLLVAVYNNSTESTAYLKDKEDYEDDDLTNAERNIKREYTTQRIVISEEYLEAAIEHTKEVIKNTASANVLGNELTWFVPFEGYTSYDSVVTNYSYYSNATIPMPHEYNYSLYAENVFLLTTSEGLIQSGSNVVIKSTKIDTQSLDHLENTSISETEGLLWGGTINSLNDTAFLTNNKTAMFITEGYGSITIDHNMASVFDVLANGTRPLPIEGNNNNEEGESYQYEQYAYSEPRSSYILISSFANKNVPFADVYKYPTNRLVMPFNITSVDSEGVTKPLTIELDIVPLNHIERLINKNSIVNEEREEEIKALFEEGGGYFNHTDIEKKEAKDRVTSRIYNYNQSELDDKINRGLVPNSKPINIEDTYVEDESQEPVIPTKFEDYVYEKAIADSNDRGMAAIIKDRAPAPEVHTTTEDGIIIEHIRLLSTVIPEVSEVIAEGDLVSNESTDTAFGEVDIHDLCGNISGGGGYSDFVDKYHNKNEGWKQDKYMTSRTTYDLETGEKGVKLDSACALADVREEDEQLENSINPLLITIKISGHPDLNNHNSEIFKNSQNATNIVYEVDNGNGSFSTEIFYFAAIAEDGYNVKINTDRDNILNATRKANTLYIPHNDNFGKIININNQTMDCPEFRTCSYELNYNTGNFTVTNQWGGQAVITLNTALQLQPSGSELSDIPITQEYSWTLAVVTMTVIGFIYSGIWLHKKGIV